MYRRCDAVASAHHHKRNSMRPLILSTRAFALMLVASATSASAQPATLTIDRIVSSAPSLTGTSPTQPAWSPDGRWLAFLWNDAGRPRRDLWIVGAADSVPRRLTTEGAGEFVWAPDGQSLLMLHGDRISRVSLDGRALVQLPAGPGAASDLSMSPDGRTLAYLSKGDLWFQPVAAGPARRVTHLAMAPSSTVGLGTYNKPDLEVGRYVWGGEMRPYAWAPDGRHIAMQIVDRRRVPKVPFPYYLGEETSVSLLRRGAPGQPNESRMIAILDIATGKLTRLALAEPALTQNIAMEWSSRGELLIDRESDTAEDRWLLVANAQGVVRQIWHDRRESRIYNAVTSTWDPSGDRILFTSDLEDRYRVYALGRQGGRPEPLTPATGDVGGARGPINPIAHRETGTLWFVSNEGNPAERQVFRMPLAGGPAERITTRPGVHTPFLSPDGRTLATISSDAITPPELYLGVRRITRSPPEEFARYQWVRPRYITFPHTSDRYTLSARIFLPPNFDPARKYPVLFGPVYSNTVRNQWGGLYGMMQQLLVQRGYLVVQVDVRGSTGYGREFREKFLMDWGGGDLEDLASATEYLKTLPYADTNRMGIWGSSYGGTLTVFMLFKKPGLFKAGVAGAPATNPYFFGSDDVAIARRPGTNPEAFERGNALRYAGGLRDHLLIIQGMQDDVVPFKTSVVLADSLMKLGKDFDFAFAPAATHGWTQRDYYARFLLKKLVAHFDRYLSPAAMALP